MNYRDNTPTYNVNRRIANFSDYSNNIDAEKEELKKVKRSTKPNSEDQQHIGNSRYKFNKITRKMDDLSPNMIDDKIEGIEDIKENQQFTRNEDIKETFVSWKDYDEYIQPVLNIITKSGKSYYVNLKD